MKTKFIRPSIIFILSLFILASCGKYEEGPNISLRSKKARVANDWMLDEMYINGEPQTLSAEERSVVTSIKKDGNITTSLYIGISYIPATGTWEFYDDKEQLKTTLTYSTFFGSHTDQEIWTILRLKEKEMWLEVTEQDKDVVEYRYVAQ